MIPIGLHRLFSLKQVKLYTSWDEEQLTIAMKAQRVNSPEKLDLGGSPGLRTFSFTPLDDDFICIVKNHVTGAILDLTNYEGL